MIIIINEDSLSLMLFVIAVMPLNLLIRKCTGGQHT